MVRLAPKIYKQFIVYSRMLKVDEIKYPFWIIGIIGFVSIVTAGRQIGKVIKKSPKEKVQ